MVLKFLYVEQIKMNKSEPIYSSSMDKDTNKKDNCRHNLFMKIYLYMKIITKMIAI